MAGHAHPVTMSGGKLWAAVAVTFVFCIGEAAAGYFSNSLALMSDAGHNFADALALALAAYGLWIAGKPADAKHTFGYHRVGILAALVNAVGLVVMAGIILYEAIRRLHSPEPVDSGPMIWVALAAIVLNSVIGWSLHASAKEDLNMRGAYLHMVGDAAASFGVVIAGLIILFTGASIADPIVSILFAALVAWSSWGILKESVQILLEAAPGNIKLAHVEARIRALPGVLDIHDLHVWTVASGMVACCCHVRVADQSISSAQEVLDQVAHALEHDFRISHSTIQVECDDCGGHEHRAHQVHGHEHGHDHGHGHAHTPA
jgi:cobalt-zinc-cadmium efflux system protein